MFAERLLRRNSARSGTASSAVFFFYGGIPQEMKSVRRLGIEKAGGYLSVCWRSDIIAQFCPVLFMTVLMAMTSVVVGEGCVEKINK